MPISAPLYSPPMKPGLYLEKRRVMAGHSLSGLTRDLMMLSNFGGMPRLSDFNRLKLRLVSAEQSTMHLCDAKLEMIANFVQLDKGIYRSLVRLDRGEQAALPQICRNCACSFYDPCEDGHAACHWAEVDLCSRCARLQLSAPGNPAPAPALPFHIVDDPAGASQ